MKRITLLSLTIVLWCHPTHDAYAQTKADDGRLGSTITLEDLKSAPNQQLHPSTEANDEQGKLLFAQPVTEPTDPLRYRFYPTLSTLKPRSAYLHFSRALLLYNEVSEKTRKEFAQFQADNDENKAQAKNIEPQLKYFQRVMDELKFFGECDDLKWDLRLRDLRGKKIYEVMLPDVQQSRDLARILRYQIALQLQQHDFDGAIGSIRLGYQLSEFLMNGETLIQQLVGIAVQAMMQEAVMDAIQTPGCPNLYWALAVVPMSSASVARSMEIEFAAASHVMVVLEDPMNVEWDQATWRRKWKESLADITDLAGSSSPSAGSALALGAIAAVEMANNTAAKQRLIAYGIKPERVEQMCPEQILAIDTQLAIRQRGNQLLKGFYSPTSQTRLAATREELEFEEWLSSNRTASVAGLVTGLLFPATQSVRRASHRNMVLHQRLLLIEAIRAYAAANQGRLPQSLKDLEGQSAGFDSSADTIQYSIKQIDGRPTAYLFLPNLLPSYPNRLVKLQIAN